MPRTSVRPLPYTFVDLTRLDRKQIRYCHPINASVGRTRIARQIPRRLERTEIANTIINSWTKSSLVMTTRRGKYGNNCRPSQQRNDVTHRSQGDGLLQEHSQDHAIRRTKQFQQGNGMQFVQRQRV